MQNLAGDMDEVKQNESGSRYADGNVPNVNCNDSKLKVNWNYSNNHDDNLRSRAEIPA